MSDIQTHLAQWQDAMRRRDKLQDAREKLASAREEGAPLRAETLADVEAALLAANAEVERLQAAVLGAARG
jgi:uncharacterized protein (DUF3084 family)